MTQQDFHNLPTSLQRQFTNNDGIELVTISLDYEIIIDLFFSRKGNFFIELYTTIERNVTLDINTFNFNHQKLEKYLSAIDITSVFDTLSDFDQSGTD